MKKAIDTHLKQLELEELKSKLAISLDSLESIPLEEISSPVLILNFILGSWCPVCMNHVKAMCIALDGKGKGGFTMVIVTTEKEAKLKESLKKAKKNGLISKNLYFIAGASRELLNTFNVRVPVFGFARPATFIVEKFLYVKKISSGMPNNEKVVCSLDSICKPIAS